VLWIKSQSSRKLKPFTHKISRHATGFVLTGASRWSDPPGRVLSVMWLLKIRNVTYFAYLEMSFLPPPDGLPPKLSIEEARGECHFDLT
jgi:hypothetical protein